MLIVAWAFEQDENSKRRFKEQDVMVEWKLQQKYAKDDEDMDAESHGQMDREKRWIVYERYCHVYRSGELESLVDQVPGLELVSVEYIRSNWCLCLQRIAVAATKGSHTGAGAADTNSNSIEDSVLSTTGHD